MNLTKTLLGIIAATVFTTAAQSQEMRAVTIGVGGAAFGSAGAAIANELGLFKKHGINAKIVTMDSANAATTALIARSIEIASSGIGELIVAQGRGQKNVMVKNTYDGLPGTLVVSKAIIEKSGVSPKATLAERAKALDGLIIATPSASSIFTVVIKSAAAAVGATPRFTYMAQPAMAAALESGAIHGFISGAPSWAPPVMNGAAVVWVSGPKKEFLSAPITSSGLHAMQDFAEANKELMKGIAAAMDDFAKAANQRPDEVKAAVRRVYPGTSAETIDFVFPSEVAGWTTKQLTAGDMKHDIEFVKSSGSDLPQLDGIDPGSLLYKVQ